MAALTVIVFFILFKLNMGSPTDGCLSAYRTKYALNTQTTVDVPDVEVFSNEFSKDSIKQWLDPNGPMRALYAYNLVRVPFVRDGIMQNSTSKINSMPLKDKKILDVGCGGGILAEVLAKIGAEVTGIDASKDLIVLADRLEKLDPMIENNRPKYYHTTIEEHVTKFKNYYDAVVASEVIEHVMNPELFVKSCVEALKPGGRIFFTTPNRTEMSKVFVIVLLENVFKLVPKGTHQYEKFITPAELTCMLEKNNCQVELSYGVTFNYWTNTWKAVKSQSIFYVIQAVKLN